MSLSNKGKGRPKGSKNKIYALAKDLANHLGVDPLEILLHFASSNWKSLNYDEPTTLKFANGQTFLVPIITAEMRLNAAKEAVKYIYPTQKAVEFKADDGTSGIKVIIEDFGSK